MLSSIEPITSTKKIDGEQEEEEVIQRAKITLIEHATHDFQDGDQIKLLEVIGMKKQSSEVNVNDETFKIVEVINRNQFIVDCDMTQYSSYERNGVAKHVKTPIEATFKPLKEVLRDLSGQSFDQDLQYMDFEKIANFRNASLCFKLFGENLKEENVTNSTAPEVKDMSEEEKEQFTKFSTAFLNSRKSSINPICAFIGGVVVQEIVKGITQKFMPINQEFYFDAIELYNPSIACQITEELQKGRYISIVECFGNELLNEIKKAKVFMIGAGAIGCELLKNFAMLGLGSGQGGQITLTDPDIIEVSNLNRQFLFREKHLRKPKSVTAAAAAI